MRFRPIRAAALRMPAHPQSLLDLPPGEARDSLLAVHGILGTRSAAGQARDLRSRRRLDQLPAARRAASRPRHRGRHRRGPDPQQRLRPGDDPRRHPDLSLRARQLRSRDLLQRHRASSRCRGGAVGLLRVAEARRPDPDRRAEPEIAVRRRHQISRRTGSMSGSTAMCAATRRPASPARRRSRPSSIRWSRFRSSKLSPRPTGCR